jgi:hypothetical protein
MGHPTLSVSRRIAACWIIAMSWANLSARADTLWLNGNGQPRFGRVVSRPDTGDVLFRLRGEDNAYSEQTFARDEIALLVVNIDVPRLESLDPSRLHQYRDYAEELAGQKIDPEARDLAIRLYLIAAAGAHGRNEPDLVESALNGLPELARNELEHEEFARLQLLHARTPRKESTATGQSVIKQEPATSTDDRARQQLLQAIRLIRRENNAAALKILSLPDVQAELKKWSELVSAGDVRAMTNSVRLTLPQLRNLLTLEMALQNGEDQPSHASPSPGWSEQAQEPMRDWTRLPTFANVTEFDPARSIFRGGQWLEPVVPASSD